MQQEAAAEVGERLPDFLNTLDEGGGA